ncbi:MAG: hypothetical protein LBD99_00700 [Candidatus Margulisbacteria bacterium]|jgi:SAM-dependent methyltransferase|nr:hypothetical protein [Candidatus Margulisiibacteriota bacterium]
MFRALKIISVPAENPQWIVNRTWQDYQLVWRSLACQKDMCADLFWYTPRKLRGLAVLDIGAGQGYAAADLKIAGVYRYDNLALTVSGNSFIDREYPGDIDNFCFAGLSVYDLIISCYGGLYYSQRVMHNILELLPHLKSGGHFIATTGWLSEHSLEIVLAYLDERGYRTAYARGLLYIQSPLNARPFDPDELAGYYTRQSGWLLSVYPDLLAVRIHADDLLTSLIERETIGSHIYNRLISWASGNVRRGLLFDFSRILYDYFQITGNTDFQKQDRLEKYFLDRFLAGRYPALINLIAELQIELAGLQEGWQDIRWVRYRVP